eukprot:4836974-Alexandrium_andersonii.AAC.1
MPAPSAEDISQRAAFLRTHARSISAHDDDGSVRFDLEMQLRKLDRFLSAMLQPGGTERRFGHVMHGAE